MWFLWKQGIKPSDMQHQSSAIYGQKALCSTGYGASTVARELHRRLSMSGVAALLNNGSMKLSRRSQRHGSDVSS
jgi:hypothetical protein